MKNSFAFWRLNLLVNALISDFADLFFCLNKMADLIEDTT